MQLEGGVVTSCRLCVCVWESCTQFIQSCEGLIAWVEYGLNQKCEMQVFFQNNPRHTVIKIPLCYMAIFI